jgi:hypothetical protein
MSASSVQNFSDRLGQLIPLRPLGVQMLLPRTGQCVKPRPPVVRGRGPGSVDPTQMFHPVEGRIERALLDPQDVVRDRLDVRRDAVAVMRTAAQNLENQQIERALERIPFLVTVQHYPRTLG